MKPIYVDELFNRRVIISELGSCLKQNDTIGASVVADVVPEDASVSTKIKKKGKEASSNQDKYYLKEQQIKKPIDTVKVAEESSADVRTVGEVVKSAVVPDKQNYKSSQNI